MAKPKKTKSNDNMIVQNKKARHDYFIQDTVEAGMVLEGWEVKAARLKKVQLVDSYVLMKDGEAFLLGCNITPLDTASTHVIADPGRTKKLLLHKRELAKLFMEVGQKGYTAVATKMYWKGHMIKCEVGLAKGKQEHDKRAADKDREWKVEKQRVVRHTNR